MLYFGYFCDSTSHNISIYVCHILCSGCEEPLIKAQFLNKWPKDRSIASRGLRNIRKQKCGRKLLRNEKPALYVLKKNNITKFLLHILGHGKNGWLIYLWLHILGWFFCPRFFCMSCILNFKNKKYMEWSCEYAWNARMRTCRTSPECSFVFDVIQIMILILIFFACYCISRSLEFSPHF